MKLNSLSRSIMRTLAAGVGVGIAAYGAYAGVAWYRYGRVAAAHSDDRDEWLDQYMPRYDVVERHHIRVAAPPAITLDAAKEQDLLQMPLIRIIFKTREVVLGATSDDREQSGGLLTWVQSLGWRMLTETPGREIVMGAVTRPWEANVTFRGLPPEEFEEFSEPGFVKIVWTLRADPEGSNESVFRTETRAMATDSAARARFRRYWAFASPGIRLIRRLSLHPLKREAERRAAA